MDSKRYSLIVEKAGVRLDKYVSEQCPGVSRTQAQKLIDDGCIKVNDRLAKASLKLNPDDRVNITIPLISSATLSPEEIPLNIVYEDTDLLVIDKPAGLAVHPAPGHTTHTLVNAILSRFPELSDDSLRPGIVHRLDKDTSGLMLIAKNNAAKLNLMEQFKKRLIVKSYVALVKGHLSPEDGAIEASIGRDPHYRKRMAIVTEGKEARTQYHVIKYLGNHTLVEVKPETGRTHQIRVHMAAIGHPVMGDPLYGVKTIYLSRQFLHASRLGFRLPSSGKYVEFNSELPPDLAQALASIA
ncbi:MAG: RluA family pseudouridine synthase [Dehalococcoidales bacterium]|nr:RluA family pseudouridine synthase [Dehalococcoidales bacterium]